MAKKQKSESALQVYVNEEFGDIRGMMINDEIWFVGKDVAEALGYKDVNHAILDHVDEEDRINAKTQGQNVPEFGQRGTWLINESGLYSLILTSQLPKAKEFKRWVTSEVLPSIRKTGVYSVNDKAYQKWLASRQHGIISRKKETDTVKTFIEYARMQGCTWEDKYFYSTISIWCNVGAGLPQRGGRNFANIQQLNTIDLLEGTVIKNVLINGMVEGLQWLRIWVKAQQKINLFCELTNKELPELK